MVASLIALTGDWDLAGASYSFPDLVTKPAGRSNTLSFRGSFDREQFRLKREREFAEQAAEAQEMPEEFDPNVLIGRVQGTV